METRDLIVDDGERGVFRYHRSTMTSARILEAERERIFDRCWLYLGHESEVEQPGDFRRRTVAGRPLFFVRDKEGEVRVFLNTCPHRGALICRQDEGNARVFQCFYHSWTFNMQGDLVARPDDAGYSQRIEESGLCLMPPPRVDSYRGFCFVSFNPDVEDLPTYLAGAKDYLDLIADQSEAGLKVNRGTNKYSVRSNWKLLVENASDAYHLLQLHSTYFSYMSSLMRDLPGESLRSSWRPGVARPLGNGHTVIDAPGLAGRTVAHWHPVMGEDTREEVEGIRRRLVELHGEERTRQIADTNHSLLIYPNMLINDFVFTIIRVFEPTAPGGTEATAWSIAPREHSPTLLARRLDNFITFLGPGGLGTPDDTEAVESCQAGMQAGEMEWSDVSRGMHREALSFDELQMRTFWRQWRGNMMGVAKVEAGDRIPAKRDD